MASSPSASRLGDSLSLLPYVAEFRGAPFDDSAAAWRKRRAGIYWVQVDGIPYTGYVLHMTRPSAMAQMAQVRVDNERTYSRTCSWEGSVWSSWV